MPLINFEALQREALDLATPERARLALALLDSLDANANAGARQWLEDCERLALESDADQVPLFVADEAESVSPVPF
ncbi:MAG: hypothetical protein QM718_12895 [Steroidobacteraceae bacterium]